MFSWLKTSQKYCCGWGFVVDSTEELEALPKLPSWIFGLLCSGEGKERGMARSRRKGSRLLRNGRKDSGD